MIRRILSILIPIVAAGAVLGAFFAWRAGFFPPLAPSSAPVTPAPAPGASAPTSTVSVSTSASSTLAAASSTPAAPSGTPARALALSNPSTTTTPVAPHPVAIVLPPPPVPAVTVPVSQTAPAGTSTTPAVSPIIADRDITAKANVGLLCHFKFANAGLAAAYAGTSAVDSDGEFLEKASGVIVSPEGYILTAKHLVNPRWAASIYGSTMTDDERFLYQNLVFDRCDVGVPGIDTVPTTAMIASLNPQSQLPQPFPYIATLRFEPQRGNLSDVEYKLLDFALLRITAPLRDCQTFGMCQLPSSFPYNPVIREPVPAPGEQLVSFGYPAELINSSGGSFTTFYLKGAIGPLVTYYYGDSYFHDQPLEFQWKANDVLPGRSGSPIYWHGYVAGLQSGASTDNVTVNYAVGMPAIYKILSDNGLQGMVAVN